MATEYPSPLQAYDVLRNTLHQRWLPRDPFDALDDIAYSDASSSLERFFVAIEDPTEGFTVLPLKPDAKRVRAFAHTLSEPGARVSVELSVRSKLAPQWINALLTTGFVPVEYFEQRPSFWQKLMGERPMQSDDPADGKRWLWDAERGDRKWQLPELVFEKIKR